MCVALKGHIRHVQQAIAQSLKCDGAHAAPEPLPEGWAEAKDAQERTYYWHIKTKKVQWERPTAQSVP